MRIGFDKKKVEKPKSLAERTAYDLLLSALLGAGALAQAAYLADGREPFDRSRLPCGVRGAFVSRAAVGARYYDHRAAYRDTFPDKTLTAARRLPPMFSRNIIFRF